MEMLKPLVGATRNPQDFLMLVWKNLQVLRSKNESNTPVQLWIGANHPENSLGREYPSQFRFLRIHAKRNGGKMEILKEDKLN